MFILKPIVKAVRQAAVYEFQGNIADDSYVQKHIGVATETVGYLHVLSRHAKGQIGNLLYLIGGHEFTPSVTGRQGIRTFDGSTVVLTSYTTQPLAFSACMPFGAAGSETLYVYGGDNGNAYSNVISAFTGRSNSTIVAYLPSAGSGLNSAAKLSSKGYIFGFLNTSGTPNTTILSTADGSTMVTIAAKLRGPGRGIACPNADGSVAYVFGPGTSAAQTLNISNFVQATETLAESSTLLSYPVNAAALLTASPGIAARALLFPSNDFISNQSSSIPANGTVWGWNGTTLTTELSNTYGNIEHAVTYNKSSTNE